MPSDAEEITVVPQQSHDADASAGAQMETNTVANETEAAIPNEAGTQPPPSQPNAVTHDSTESYGRLVLFTIAIATCGFLFGFDTGTIGSLVDLPAFVENFADNNSTTPKSFHSLTKGALIGTSSIGGALGGLSTSLIVPFLGHRLTILIAVICAAVGNTIIICSTHWTIVLLGRLFYGLCCGLCCVTCPLLISELAPLANRGVLISFFQFFCTLGILAGASTLYASNSQFGGNRTNLWQYRFPLIEGIGFAAISGSLIYLVPESPVWLVSRGEKYYKAAQRCVARARGWEEQDERARTYVLRLAGTTEEALKKEEEQSGETVPDDPEVPERQETQNEVTENGQENQNEEVENNHNQEEEQNQLDSPNDEEQDTQKEEKKKPFKPNSIRHGEPRYLLRLVTGLCLQVFQQFTGINYFFFYGASIFRSAGMNDPYLVPVFFGAINLLFSFVSVGVVSTLKRTTLLIFGSSCLAAVLFVFSTVGVFAGETTAGAAVMVVAACCFIATFANSWGPLVGIIGSEMYPHNIKVKSMAICGCTGWLATFTVSLLIPVFTDLLGFGLGYIFVVLILAGLGFVIGCVPETKLIQIEELDEKYRTHTYRRFHK